MRILNISKLKLNDAHTYYGGAIGNIAYNQLAALARLDDIELVSFTEGTDLRHEPPDSLRLIEVGSYAEIASRLDDLLDDVAVVTHLYFHEPEYNPVSKDVVERGVPFVIGMCEAPHPRLRDEVHGLQKLPLVRRVGKRLLLPRFERTLRRCDRLIAVDEQANDYYAEYVPSDRIERVPYGVDCDRFDATPLPGVPRVLMVNRLIRRRGVDQMIEALPAVLARVPAAELHLVGDGPRRERLKTLAGSLGVGSAVTFHGNVSSGRLVELYREAAVFSHLSFADGWNQPALEAMASGRPVVCSDAPHNSMVEESRTGHRVPPGDVDALAARLVELLQDRERAAEMGALAREIAEEEYDWASIALRYQRVLRDVSS